jgi:superfamily II DNA or RNA helicase
MCGDAVATRERSPGAIQLRPYQLEAIEAIERAVDRGVRRPLLVLPTGAGKIQVFASLIAQRGGSALVLAHRDELLEQAAAKIRTTHPEMGMAVGFVAAERNDTRAPVVVGSVQTLARENRLAQLPQEFRTVVVDEAHRAAARSYRKILEHLSPCPLILGVTATPSRADGKQLGDVWQEIVYQRGIVEMIREGYLCDVRGVRLELEVELEKVRQSGGDFDEGELGDALEDASAPEHAVHAYRRHAYGRRALLFAPTVKMARTFACAFREAGVAAEAVDGTTPLEARRGMLERIQTGDTRVLANVMVMSEGVDVPAVDAVIMACPTRSEVKYSQCLGRALRTHPGKDDCVVIDLVGVTDRLDLQTLPRLFGLRQQPSVDVSVVDALDHQRTADRAREEKQATGKRPEAPKGTLRSRQVSLLGRRQPRARRLRWLRHRECWLLSLGSAGTLALVPDGQRWRVLRLHAGKHEQLAGGVDLGYAHGIAEDVVRASGAEPLAAPHARWRGQPMNAAQAGLLRRLGVTPPEGASKGEASDLITVARATELLDRLASEAA